MTDATSSPMRPSSSAAESHSSDSSGSKLNEDDVYPFLVHSQNSVTNGDPPEVDNSKLARQKRRRTSPEDQAKLETEYKRNPKPDKVARIEIVNKVSLGEKEVQIWFQNRRQNTRRKSRPLLPHEIAAFGLNGMAAFTSDATSSSFFGSSQDTGYNPSSSQLNIASSCQESSGQLGELSVSSKQRKSAKSRPDDIAARPTQELVSVAPVNVSHYEVFSENTKVSESATISQSQVQSSFLPCILGYLSNRRHASVGSSTRPMQSQVSTFSKPLNSRISQPASCPERLLAGDDSAQSSSQVRLSLSMDGKAELISSKSSPIRPWLPRPVTSGFSSTLRHPGGLQRSQSALSLGHLTHKNSSTALVAPNMPSGRSRDARTWAFCCDIDARDELTTQAENESSGSALAAINLIRSTTNITLKPNLNKRNAPAPKQDSSKHGKKPKLARVSSSMAKLQGNKKSEVLYPSGDSDKENWPPNNDNGANRRHLLPTFRPSKQGRRRTLEECLTVSGHTATSRSGPQKGPINIDAIVFENASAEEVVDHEVAKFMRGEVSPSKKGDLDCIQGLLSLSQGNWR